MERDVATSDASADREFIAQVKRPRPRFCALGSVTGRGTGDTGNS
jgi:hypothetical protein